ncbi:hypothetical protein BCR37DRAFT_384971 [Protomyces lactucae-debilis]|uniref:BSD domain-containing protein n=1 Tax=Protomyces lactucae-debilis TaxID=2754530 RepID=A0A1Y2FUG9_PROLT|nr:uncharacterized protein BCR37DRAFT_384971 [Protomyces lactucae-debilis]ORY87661.1 hypothetical protein BCR37DRAFT_384971 [Protomyces lactucae-debilis]
MATASGAVAYKKQDGRILLKEHHVEWAEKGAMQASLTIALTSITNLQASPATKEVSQMRIHAAPSAASEPVAHTFKFTNKKPTAARAEMDAFVAALQTAISAKKEAPKVFAKPSVNEILSSQDVESDAALQESLLKSDPELASTFKEAVISGSVTPAQFWSSRIHLLRSHLIERSQQKGPYNVLATIRPKTVDNKIRVNMTREKIRDVFEQHPLLKRVYDECVPPMTEDNFWSRFFVSRLCKKLRGEVILPADPIDDKLDKYLSEQEESRKRGREDEEVPHVINIEGNEEHNSKKMGNAPDFTMRPSRTEAIHSINQISLRMLDSLTPAEAEAAAIRNNAFEQQYYQQDIQLGDLQIDEEEERILLNVRDQSNFFRAPTLDRTRSDHPAETLSVFQSSLSNDFSLEHVGEDQAALDEMAQALTAMIGARGPKSLEATLPANAREALIMCHGAAQEFLSIFWTGFLSGDPSKARSLAKMIDTLRKTGERVENVAKSAGTGREAVERCMRPTLVAVDKAITVYQQALEAAR